MTGYVLCLYALQVEKPINQQPGISYRSTASLSQCRLHPRFCLPNLRRQSTCSFAFYCEEHLLVFMESPDTQAYWQWKCLVTNDCALIRTVSSLAGYGIEISGLFPISEWLSEHYPGRHHLSSYQNISEVSLPIALQWRGNCSLPGNRKSDFIHMPGF